MIHGNTRLYGICNVAFYATRPEGTETYYRTQADRDAALDRLRSRAISVGLAPSAARSGIYPVESRVAAVRRRLDYYHVRACDDDLHADLASGLSIAARFAAEDAYFTATDD